MQIVLVFTSCLTMSLNSVRGKSFGPLPIFPGHTYSPTHVDFHIPWNMSELFKFPVLIHQFSLSFFFFFDSLIRHLFDPTGLTTSGNCLVNRCPRLISTNALEIRLLVSKFWVRSNKNKFYEWHLFRNLPGNKKQSLGEDIYKSYIPWVNIQSI